MYILLQISEIVSRFERKGYKLVAIKLIVPSKEFAEKHYHDLKERPFFNGLCDFLSSGPVLAMVSRPLISAQKNCMHQDSESYISWLYNLCRFGKERVLSSMGGN